MMPDDDGQWHIFGGWIDEGDNKCETMVFKEELDERGYAHVPEYHEIDTEYSFDAGTATIVHHDMVRKYEEDAGTATIVHHDMVRKYEEM
jgi:hypothetical protein